MKLGKILGTLLVLLAMFVFVGCGDPGVLTLEAITYGNDCLYESMTLSLQLGYQDYRDCEKVDKIVLYNKTLDKVIYETENSPYKNPKALYEIKIDYDWVTEEEGEKVYEYYWQHGENISNTVAVKVKHYNPFRVYCDDYTAIPAESDDGDSYNIQKLYYIPDVYRFSPISMSIGDGPMYTMYEGIKFTDPFYLILSNYEDDKFFSNFNTLTQYVMNEGENSFTKTNVVINKKDGGYYTVNFTPTVSCKIYFETPNGDKSDVITLEKVNLDPDLQCIYDISAEEIDESLKLHANSTEQQRTITVSFNGNNKEMILYNNVTFEAEVIPPFVGKMEKEIVLPATQELGYGYSLDPILCLKWKWGKLGTEVCDIAGAVIYVDPDNYTE